MAANQSGSTFQRSAAEATIRMHSYRKCHPCTSLSLSQSPCQHLVFYPSSSIPHRSPTQRTVVPHETKSRCTNHRKGSHSSRSPSPGSGRSWRFATDERCYSTPSGGPDTDTYIHRRQKRCDKVIATGDGICRRGCFGLPMPCIPNSDCTKAVIDRVLYTKHAHVPLRRCR